MAALLSLPPWAFLREGHGRRSGRQEEIVHSSFCGAWNPWIPRVIVVKPLPSSRLRPRGDDSRMAVSLVAEVCRWTEQRLSQFTYSSLPVLNLLNSWWHLNDYLLNWIIRKGKELAFSGAWEQEQNQAEECSSILYILYEDFIIPPLDIDGNRQKFSKQTKYLKILLIILT